MDPIAYEGLLDKLDNRSWIVKKVVDLLKDDKEKFNNLLKNLENII